MNVEITENDGRSCDKEDRVNQELKPSRRRAVARRVAEDYHQDGERVK